MPVAADFIDSVQGAAFAGDDVIGGFAPDERLWLGVVEQEIIVDGRVQIIEAGIAFPANASRGDLGKEPFDQVQPRRAGRREGPLEAGRAVCPTRPSLQASCGGHSYPAPDAPPVRPEPRGRYGAGTSGILWPGDRNADRRGLGAGAPLADPIAGRHAGPV